MKDQLDGWTWKSGDSDAEADPEPPGRGRYAVPRIRRTPAQSARAAAAWIRARWIKLTVSVTVLVLAVGGWQTYDYVTRFHEQMSGPHGDFPAALGTTAPKRPGRVLTSGDSTPAGIVGGLVLNEQSDGTVATNVRTGKSYWHYGREKAALLAESLVGDAVVLWYDDGLVVSVELRSGKPRWHTKVARKVRSESGGRVWHAGDTVIISRQNRLTGLSARSGKQLWSIAPPTGCKEWDTRAPVDLSGTEAFDATECSRTEAYAKELYGVDPASGRTHWHLKDESIGYGRLGDHTLVSLTLSGSLVTADVSGARPQIHMTALSHDAHLRGISDGMVLIGSKDDTSLTARQVGDDSSSKALWTVKAGKGYELGLPRTADGRVYIPRYERLTAPPTHQDPGAAQLLVLDARSGHELHRTVLPASLYEGTDDVGTGTMAVLGAGYGVVRVGWTGFVASAAQVSLAD
ncbi:PQQ-binding-like beta-propeller repeat protein [Streptomyces sp. NBC_01089]|uniref:outer membrane protein assembly factor BamB family protein n=1 Tax=Streptomyces sp. NBC_01089 TaxID=2903747 RepID=UPI003863DBD0|nr:PQQ-binding-like beta-propeller repeat protein [Streptomyces sp. NBC_01089]